MRRRLLPRRWRRVNRRLNQHAVKSPRTTWVESAPTTIQLRHEPTAPTSVVLRTDCWILRAGCCAKRAGPAVHYIPCTAVCDCASWYCDLPPYQLVQQQRGSYHCERNSAGTFFVHVLCFRNQLLGTARDIRKPGSLLLCLIGRSVTLQLGGFGSTLRLQLGDFSGSALLSRHEHLDDAHQSLIRVHAPAMSTDRSKLAN